MELFKVSGQRLAQANGKRFEELFEAMTRAHGCAVTRFPDGCQQLGKGRIKRVKTPFDWIVTHAGTSFLIDTKRCGDKYFAHSQIEKHQVDDLIKHERVGAVAGYVIDFVQHDCVVFVAASALVRRVYGGTGSVKITDSDVVVLGNRTTFDVRKAKTQARA